jgi:hypothetical protein
MEPASPGRSARWRLAETFAAVSFAYALGAAVVLMAVTGMFGGLLAWLVLPILASFGSWMAVRSGRPVLRIVIWLSVIFCLFFVWIAVFSFGLVFLPVPALLILAGFSPWTGEVHGRRRRPE